MPESSQAPYEALALHARQHPMHYPLNLREEPLPFSHFTVTLPLPLSCLQKVVPSDRIVGRQYGPVSCYFFADVF